MRKNAENRSKDKDEGTKKMATQYDKPYIVLTFIDPLSSLQVLSQG